LWTPDQGEPWEAESRPDEEDSGCEYLRRAHLNGERDRLQDLRRAVQEEGPNLVVLAGDVLASGSRPPKIATHALHQALHTLATLPCAVALVPGELDASERHCGGRRDTGSRDVRHHRSCVTGPPRSGAVCLDRHASQQASGLPHNHAGSGLRRPPSTSSKSPTTDLKRGKRKQPSGDRSRPN
jgi:hypothetical protein